MFLRYNVRILSLLSLHIVVIEWWTFIFRLSFHHNKTIFWRRKTSRYSCLYY